MSKERDPQETGGEGGGTGAGEVINSRKRPVRSRDEVEDEVVVNNSKRSTESPSAVVYTATPVGGNVGRIAGAGGGSPSMQLHKALQLHGGSGMSAAAIVTPCAACKLLRRRCAQECPFAPYFSPHEPQKFACVHKVYGASNVSKMLMEVQESQRADTANSLVYEANARIRDPVYGCMGIISALQQQARNLQAELNVVKSEVMRYRASHAENTTVMHNIAATAIGNSPFSSVGAMHPTASAAPSPPDNITSYIAHSTATPSSTENAMKSERFWSNIG
ncbi:hypothetical protein KP509_12G063300 [Ceratopteris richardii]|uniref:LOB domain-containing protein n=1 Tax=Ceratopteris richardii TaxID=49495 RepID=A0A8T2TJN3_CERRI|nr:hypothetical protein KP509_12G063300 [Ceratopteris richardii]